MDDLEKIDAAAEREFKYALARFQQATRANSLTFALALQKLLWLAFAKIDRAATVQMLDALADLTAAATPEERGDAETRRRHAVAELAKAAAPPLIVRASAADLTALKGAR